MGLPRLSGATVVLRDGTRWEGELQLKGETLRVRTADGAAQAAPWSALRSVLVSSQREVFREDATLRPVICETNVPLNQSANDALNGIVGVLRRSDGDQQPKPHLTDATDAQHPDEDHGWFAGEVTWDLGTAISPGERQLDAVSIWIRASDKARRDYSGWLAVSMDGGNYEPLRESGVAVHFGAGGKAEKDSFNHVLYRCAPGRVVGFRYLRWIVYTPSWTGCDTRFVEVDAFVTRVSPHSPIPGLVILRDGTRLAGEVQGMTADQIQFQVERRWRLTLPMWRLGRLYLAPVNPEGAYAIPADATGVLLKNGQFLQGRISAWTREEVTLRSVLFGSRRLRVRDEVLALAWHPLQRVRTAWTVITRCGSKLLAAEVRPEQDALVVQLRDGSAWRFALSELHSFTRGHEDPAPARQ